VVLPLRLHRPQHGCETRIEGWGGQPTFTAEQIRFFETQVKPVLQANCYACHGAGANLSGGLQLNNRATLLKGGMSGSAVSLSKPKRVSFSRPSTTTGVRCRRPARWRRIRSTSSRNGSRWVCLDTGHRSRGQGDQRDYSAAGQCRDHEVLGLSAGEAFQSAAVKNAAWVRNPIDAFILAKLESKGLKPAPAASRVVLIRRAYYDLTGLPPTPAEVQAFLADKSPNAWEKVVDRLLASPHYGDVGAALARSGPLRRDQLLRTRRPKPFVWRYRDYVIRAFNSDKPYDQFIREQLAGDELPNVTSETMIATGYYRLGQWDDEPADPEQARYDELDDIVATTGRPFSA